MILKIIMCIAFMVSTVCLGGCNEYIPSPQEKAYQDAVAAIQHDPWTSYAAIDNAVRINRKEGQTLPPQIEQMKLYGDYLKRITDKEHELKAKGPSYYLKQYQTGPMSGTALEAKRQKRNLLERGKFSYYKPYHASASGKLDAFNMCEIEPLAEQYWSDIIPHEISETITRVHRGRRTYETNPIVNLKYAVDAEIHAIEAFAETFNKANFTNTYIIEETYENGYIPQGRGYIPGVYIPPSSSDVRVNGYFRRNGTYVDSYMRTGKDAFESNNFSHRGNINPYTGKKGYKK